ncbi:PHD finger protein ALFIN-LIKE 5 [Bienertia sinuspersici]
MNPRTVEDVIKDFKGRRAAIIKALTKEFEELYILCDPNHPNLCLYGFPNQVWEVNLPGLSGELPEPRVGINFARDVMTRHEWLRMVSVYSDSWLASIASYFATKFSFDKADRKRLSNKINDVPLIWEVVGGKAKKRVKIKGGCLPEEILDEEVLSRLPVRDLLNYRCVCKTWRSLIDDLKFVSIHLKKYKNNSEESHLLVMSRSPRSSIGNEQVLVRRGDTFRKVQQVQNSYAFDTWICYVNGVILVKRGGFRCLEVVLWNPSIARSLSIPKSMLKAMKDATYVELGLGYEFNSNDYKVVAIIYPHAEFIRSSLGKRYCAIVPGLVLVYTLSNDSWTSNLGVSPPPYWSVGKQLYMKGAIHWINFGPKGTNDLLHLPEDSYVVLFDVKDEVFRYFELPFVMKSNFVPQEKLPTILNGSFAIFCAYDHEARHDIWVMNEYGVPESWSKCYTFTLQFDKLLHFKSNGELFYAIHGKGIKSYDINTKRVKDLAKTYSRYSKCRIYTYVESLVLLKEGKLQRPNL